MIANVKSGRLQVKQTITMEKLGVLYDKKETAEKIYTDMLLDNGLMGISSAGPIRRPREQQIRRDIEFYIVKQAFIMAAKAYDAAIEEMANLQ